MCSPQHPQCFHHSKHLEAGANERKIASTRGEEEGHCISRQDCKEMECTLASSQNIEGLTDGT